MRRQGGTTRGAGWALAVTGLLAAGCGGLTVHSDATHSVLLVSERELQEDGLALLTPSTVTGREQDREVLAQTFYAVMRTRRPDVRVSSLAQTLSAVNRAGLDENYERMFVEARDTGLYRRDSLREVAEVTGARFLAQLKLADFRQESLLRWSFLGLRLTETKRARLRVFLQLWDSTDGAIVWEGSVEINQAVDTSGEREITLSVIAQRAAHDLIAGLPGTLAPAPLPAGFAGTAQRRPPR